MANSIIGKSMFAGLVLLTPYYRLFTERLYESYKFLLPLSYVKPNYYFPCEYSDAPEEYVAKYKWVYDDPLVIDFFFANTAKIWVEEQNVANKTISSIQTPILSIAGSKDGVVRNDYIEEYSRLSQST